MMKAKEKNCRGETRVPNAARGSLVWGGNKESRYFDGGGS